jgi:hypothetical protein
MTGPLMWQVRHEKCQITENNTFHMCDHLLLYVFFSDFYEILNFLYMKIHLYTRIVQ